MKKYDTSLLRKALLFLGMFTIALLTEPRSAQAQEKASCETVVPEANTHFLFGRFDAASGLLEACLRRDAFADEQKLPVYKLLVRIYDAKQLEDKVQEALARLMVVVPDYEPELGDPPRFRELVAAYKREAVTPAETQEKLPDPEAEKSPAQEEQADSKETPVGGDPLTGETEPVDLPEQGAASDDTETPAPIEPVVEVALAQEQGEGIRNVYMRREDDRVVISYDLVGTARKYGVQVLLSNDRGGRFELVPTTLTGDTGNGVRPGAGKRIDWSVLEDFPQGLMGDYQLQLVTNKQKGNRLLYVVGGVILAGVATTVAILVSGQHEPSSPSPHFRSY